MANRIAKAEKFLPVIDDIYKKGSYTSGLDTPQLSGYFSGVNKIHIMKINTTGLGNYDRNTGYPEGDVNASFEEMTLTQERGKTLTIDRLDNEEALGMVFGAVTGQFMRDHVVPEIDAYRFAKYVSGAGNEDKDTGVKLTKETILPAIDEAVRFQDSKEVPSEGRMLFVNSDLKPILSAGINRTIGNEFTVNRTIDTYNGIPITYVTPGRFFSEITLKDGKTEYGFTKGSNGKSINFILMKREAILQGVKFDLPKIFTPDENQTLDAWLFQYRNYHDIKVLDNKKVAIYASIGTE